MNNHIKINVAHTEEYKNYQQEFNWLFKLNPVQTDSFFLGESNEYIVNYTTYSKTEVSSDDIMTSHSVKKVRITNKDNRILLDYSVIGDHLMVKLIHHQNGNEYLIFNTDLYGYSVMDIAGGDISHYIPKCSFNGTKETFIWTDVLYCKINNLLVVDGCYWACQWTNEFYDFSQPMKLPLYLYGDGYQLENYLGMDINNDILTKGFTDKGECIIEGQDENNNKIVKTIDIIKWSKN